MPKLIDADKINAYLQKNSVNHTLADIDAQPTVDAEPVRQGHWIEIHEVLGYIKCSECGKYWCIVYNDTETFNYCPNCGAKMDEVEDEE